MLKHDCRWTESDECPKRYSAIKDRLHELKLIEQCELLPSRFATKEDILLAHDEAYYESVLSTKGYVDDEGLEKLKQLSSKFDGVYFNEFTYECAMLAAGCSLSLTDAVIEERLKNGFALIRTPGHHAMKEEANGYCIFNNAAIAAKNALTKHNLERILIVDWDIHHGQGTQSFFYDDPRVLYISIHRYEKGKFWPELIESNYNFTGAAEAKGFNMNIPLNETGTNDGDYLSMWFNVILPVAYEFDPELVIVSAGYDAALGCPEGEMRLKPVTYHTLSNSLMSLANGKVVCLLEGGYNLVSLAEGAALTLRTLLGYPCPPIDHRYIEMSLHQSAIQSILDVIWALRPQWKLLSIQGKYSRSDPDIGVTAGGPTENRTKYGPIVEFQGDISTSGKKLDKYDLNGVACVKDQAKQDALTSEIKEIIANTDLSIPSATFEKQTYLVYDDIMLKHKCKLSHPEKPGRYTGIMKRLNALDLVSRCTIGKSRQATFEELELAHDRDYIEKLKTTRLMSPKELGDMASKWDSIYLNEFSYECAITAAGCCLQAVDQVMNRKNLNAFAIIRPPGHHAGKDYAAGFCLFNNAVVAGRYALDKYGESCKRVLIFDYDIHHGDGVQALVQDDERFLYISIHRYDDAAAYPYKTLSNYSNGGKNIINIPWNDHIMTETEYMMAMFNIVLPCAYEFNPDLVIISSGFDAAINDPLGQYKVQPSAYGHFIHHMKPLAGGKMVVCLEGGYNITSIAESSAHVLSVLLGDPPKRLKMNEPSEAALITMRNVIGFEKTYYKMLQFDSDLPDDVIET